MKAEALGDVAYTAGFEHRVASVKRGAARLHRAGDADLPACRSRWHLFVQQTPTKALADDDDALHLGLDVPTR